MVTFPNASRVLLFTDAQYKSLVGRSFNQVTDCIAVMNGEMASNGGFMLCCVLDNSTKNIYVQARLYGVNNQTANGMTRVNYAIFAR